MALRGLTPMRTGALAAPCRRLSGWVRTKPHLNIGTIGHVDHGKTSLCDQLLSHNGLVSARQAGQLRVLDDLEEEQRRGITIRASSPVSLEETWNG